MGRALLKNEYRLSSLLRTVSVRKCMSSKLGLGVKPSMSELPKGGKATFSFRGLPLTVDTEYGIKWSFPITLISHPTHSFLNREKENIEWVTIATSAKMLFKNLGLDEDNKPDPKIEKAYGEAYAEGNVWCLNRFDTGAYWLDLATDEELKLK
jgi:hypothetical protein